MDKPIFFEGQEVGCLMSGEGVVLEIKESMVTVRFKDELGDDDFFNNGAWLQHQRPTLYPIEQYRAIIANLPAPQPEAWQPKKGELIWVSTRKYLMPNLRKFIGMRGDLYMCEDSDGVNQSPWPCGFQYNGELPEHLKEVQR